MYKSECSLNFLSVFWEYATKMSSKTRVIPIPGLVCDDSEKPQSRPFVQLSLLVKAENVKKWQKSILSHPPARLYLTGVHIIGS